MTTPQYDDAGDTDETLEPRCACSHSRDEHDSMCCTIDDCGCFYFDEEPC